MPASIPSSSNADNIPLPTPTAYTDQNAAPTSTQNTPYAADYYNSQQTSTYTQSTTETPPMAPPPMPPFVTDSVSNPNQYTQYPPPPEGVNLPAYDATQGYPPPAGQYGPPDPGQYGQFPGYDYSQPPPPQGYDRGYYDNTGAYNQGWGDSYYGGMPPPPHPPPDWNAGNWGGPPQWGNHDPSQQHWDGNSGNNWGFDPRHGPPPPMGMRPPFMPPPGDFSMPPPPFGPRPPPPPGLNMGGGPIRPPPLLGPGGVLNNRMRPPSLIDGVKFDRPGSGGNPSKRKEKIKQMRFYMFNKERKLTEPVEVKYNI